MGSTSAAAASITALSPPMNVSTGVMMPVKSAQVLLSAGLVF
jgi:hypothetical protein